MHSDFEHKIPLIMGTAAITVCLVVFLTQLGYGLAAGIVGVIGIVLSLIFTF